MDIGSGTGYPSANLSNFHPYQFTVDDVPCNSMEGFLQSLKFSNPDMQAHVCTLVGKKAKFKEKKWFRDQTLYWKGQPIKRDSQEYQDLVLITSNKFVIFIILKLLSSQMMKMINLYQKN